MTTGPLVITGANGNLGRRLLAVLAVAGPVRALVRSREAAARLQAQSVPDAAQAPEITVVDYLAADAMTEALAGAKAVVHLVGIIKEPRAGAYYQAHEATAQVLAEAASLAGAQRIIYLSILGAHAGAANRCLASKGEAERILLESGVPTSVLRVPMVLGEGDYASAALANRARRRLSFTFRGASLEQPIYAGDVIQAIVRLLAETPASTRVVDLAGPECLSRSALTRRAAAAMGRSTRVISLPLGLGMALAWVLQRLASPPPVTPDMLGVLDHDDAIDPMPAVRDLGMSLTNLEEMLTHCLTASEAAGYPT